MADRWELVEGQLWQSNLIGAVGGGWDAKVGCTLLSEIPSMLGGSYHVLFPFKDADELPDLALLDATASLIAELTERGKRVLVSCNARHNRSGLVCGMAMMEMGKADPSNVVEMIRTANPQALDNPTFVKYLRSGA